MEKELINESDFDRLFIVDVGVAATVLVVVVANVVVVSVLICPGMGGKGIVGVTLNT
eukprot:Awhi_evm2s9968